MRTEQQLGRVLVLTGHHYAGKGHLAAALVERGWAEVALAAPLYDLLAEVAVDIRPLDWWAHDLLFGKPIREVAASHGWTAVKRIAPWTRETLNGFGRVLRSHDSQWLITVAGTRVANLTAGGTDVVISDAYKGDEIEWFATMHDGLIGRVLNARSDSPDEYEAESDWWCEAHDKEYIPLTWADTPEALARVADAIHFG